jgi:hypothetical protein
MEVASVVSDPRLPDPSLESRQATVPWKDYIGQAGWDIGVNYRTLAELQAALGAGLSPPPKGTWEKWVYNSQEKVGRGEIARLGIASHGHEKGLWFPNGMAHANGVQYPPIAGTRKKVNLARHSAAAVKEYMTDSVLDHHEVLDDIGRYTREDATILLLGCMAGDGEGGTELLMELSRVWPGRTVVAFATIGMVAAQWMRVEPSGYYAGMKDTGCDNYGKYSTRAESLLAHFSSLTWASEKAPSAKVVKDLVVKKWPAGETPYIPPQYKK